MKLIRLFPLAILTTVSGCASTAALLSQDAEWAASEPVIESAAPIVNGTIYQAGQDIRLFENSVSRRVGDVLTIRLAEVTSAQKSSSTSSSKNSNIDVPAPTLIGRDIPIGSRIWGDTSITGGTTFGGAGASAQSNSLVGDITVTVAKRWPNGNLLIRGEKWITINQGREFVRVSGIVRAADINPDNTVLSTRVADARITYSSRGVLADANKPGLLSRFFNLPWMPL